MAVTLLISQIISAVFLFVATIVCGVCPAWLGHHVAMRRQRKCEGSHSCLQQQSQPESDDDEHTGSQLGQQTLSFLMNLGGKCFDP